MQPNARLVHFLFLFFLSFFFFFQPSLRLSTPYQHWYGFVCVYVCVCVCVYANAILSFYRFAMHFIASNPSLFYTAVGSPHRNVSRGEQRAVKMRARTKEKSERKRERNRERYVLSTALQSVARASMCLRARGNDSSTREKPGTSVSNRSSRVKPD